MNLKWFLSTIVAYRYYTHVFWFPLQRKWLSRNSVEFVAKKQEAVPD